MFRLFTIKSLICWCSLFIFSGTEYAEYEEAEQSAIRNRKSNTNTLRLAGVSDDFLFWFSGFTDAEGNFLITLYRCFVKFRFKISLHIDDIVTIRSKLKIGTVTVEDSRYCCSFIVEKYADIKIVICPLFKGFPLHTCTILKALITLSFLNIIKICLMLKWKQSHLLKMVWTLEKRKIYT